MAQSLTHEVLILGAGLAGLRAAVELSHRTEGHIDIGIVSKVQLMRAHSVCAEGGTAAVLREDEGAIVEGLRRHEHEDVPALAVAARMLGTEATIAALRTAAAEAPDEECRAACRAELDLVREGA